MIAGRGPEGVTPSEAAQVSEDRPGAIVMKCEDPDFTMGVNSGNIRFLFDAVQSPDESLKALKCFLDVVLDKLAPVDLSGFEIVFQHIFYLQPGTKNFEVLANALLKGQASAAGFFQAFGDDIDWGRTDLAWVYHRRNSELISRLKLEAPGNENNSQIWFSVGTQTTGGILEPEELNRLPEYLAYDQSLVESLLSHILCGDLLDTHRREMMVDAWFEAQRRS